MLHIACHAACRSVANSHRVKPKHAKHSCIVRDSHYAFQFLSQSTLKSCGAPSFAKFVNRENRKTLNYGLSSAVKGDVIDCIPCRHS